MVDAESVPGITDRLSLRRARIAGLPDAKARTWGRFLVPFPELVPSGKNHSYARSHAHASFLTVASRIRAKISLMARGWESKSVEQQQEEMAEERKPRRAPIPQADQKRNRKRDGLLLSRERLNQQLEAATNPRHRQMLEQSIAELDRQLSSFK